MHRSAVPQAKNEAPRYSVISSKPISNQEALEGLSKFIDTRRSKMFAPRAEVLAHVQTMQTALSLEAHILERIHFQQAPDLSSSSISPSSPERKKHHNSEGKKSKKRRKKAAAE